MPGLLDFFGGSDPQTQGLLAAAAQMLQASGPSLKPVSFGQVMGGGIGAFQQAQQQAQQHQLDGILRGLQVQEAQGTLADHQRQRQHQSAIDEAAHTSMLTPEQQAASLPGGPTNANAARIPEMQGGFDTEGFLNRVMAIDPIQGLQLAQQLKKAGPEYDAGITWVNGPDGKPMGVRTAKDGSFKALSGLAPRDKLELANLGGKDVAYDPYGLKPGQTFQRTMSPDAAASNSLGWANYRLSRDNASKPTFNAEAGGWVLPPSADNPGGKLLPVAGVGGKAPTEFQGKSAAFGLRATEANKILAGLQGQYSPLSINRKQDIGNSFMGGGLIEAGANKLLSPADQQAEQAQRDFVNAILRQESGASIGAHEFDNAKRQYFPQPGDSQAVIVQKERNRELAIQGLQANAGKAALTAPGQSATTGGIKFLGFE